MGRPLEGLVLTRYGPCRPLPKHRDRREASHPVPDAAGRARLRPAWLEQARSLGKDDLLLALISGGGSAFWQRQRPE